jgi:hypothetical protein
MFRLQDMAVVSRACNILSRLLPHGGTLAPEAAQRLRRVTEDGRHASQVTKADVSAAVAAIAETRQASSERLQQLKAQVDHQQLAVRQATALGTLRCAYLGCINLASASEAQAKGKLCSGCRTVRFCSEACSQAAWRQHKAACKAIQRERQAQGQRALPHVVVKFSWGLWACGLLVRICCGFLCRLTL